ncbi:hypothetical protein HOM13_03435, partial [Candidatus Woesearchaeota archaeon]|nr:hypothetical protein [Candidatus Woesearchaeota archaeon]
SYGPEDENEIMTTLGDQVESVIDQYKNANWPHLGTNDFSLFAEHTIPHVVRRIWERGDVMQAVEDQKYGMVARKIGGSVMQASERVMRTVDLERLQKVELTKDDFKQTGRDIYEQGINNVVGTEVSMRSLSPDVLAKEYRRMQTPHSSDIVVSGEDSPLNMVSTNHED